MEPRRRPGEEPPRPARPGSIALTGHTRGGRDARPVPPGGAEDRAERASALARDTLGSWSFLGGVLTLVVAGATLADLHDLRSGAVLVLNLIASGLTLAGLSVILMATRRLDHLAGRQGRHHGAADRRSQAVDEEILTRLERLNAELAHLAARADLIDLRCRAAGGPPDTPR
jgi:hypothetical protein